MDKEIKEDIMILTGVLFGIGLIFIIVFNIVNANRTIYEYAKDGKIGTSKQCYQNKKQDCLCLIDDNFISVDNFYLKD